ncbi:MAG: DUF4879 domain-containing protein [Burkholderiales bacterium]|nr:DUF4879 domain-containing protein [Burkholderiales bacterium]
MNSFGKSWLALAGFCIVASASYADNGGKQPVKNIMDMGTVPAKLDAKLQKAFPAPSRSEVQTAAAPGLTYLQVDYVVSTNYYMQYPTTLGYEGLSNSQSMTTGDHGGAQLWVVTDELGYGDNPVATWNGGQISLATNFATQTICVNWARTGYDIPCQAGQTVVGFRKYWDFSGYQSGIFTYQNQSTNSPFNTMFDSMSIK